MCFKCGVMRNSPTDIKRLTELTNSLSPAVYQAMREKNATNLETAIAMIALTMQYVILSDIDVDQFQVISSFLATKGHSQIINLEVEGKPS